MQVWRVETDRCDEELRQARDGIYIEMLLLGQ